MENTTTPDGGETEIETISTSSAPQPELNEQHEELLELEDDEDTEEAVGTGVVAGAFGLASLALGIVSLGGNWLGNVFGNRAQYFAELHVKTATSQAQSTQQSLDAFHSNWHAQAAVGGIFALAALLIGAFVLAAPSLLLSGKSPAWARATAMSGIIIGTLGLLLAVLTWFNVLAQGLNAA
jgi:hypothetical protein